MKTRKPSNKQPKPVSQDAVAEPDIHNLIVKTNESNERCERTEEQMKIQTLIAQAIKMSELVYPWTR